jgi:hypothetical protein
MPTIAPIAIVLHAYVAIVSSLGARSVIDRLIGNTFGARDHPS